MNPITLFELLFFPDFQVGFLSGALGLALLIALPKREDPRPVWGLVVAAAVVVASWEVMVQRPGMVAGLALLALAGALRHRAAGWILVAIGATLVILGAGFDPDEVELWIRLGSVPFIAVAGWLFAAVDESGPDTGVVALMMGGSVFGVWATVPEPTLVRVILGAAAAAMIAAWPLRRARLGSSGAFALAGLLAVAIASGGEDRGGSVVGAWAAVGAFSLVLLGPVVATIRPWHLFAIHAVSVLVAARVAGLRESPIAAAAIASATIALTLAAGWLLARRERRRGPPPRPT